MRLGSVGSLNIISILGVLKGCWDEILHSRFGLKYQLQTISTWGGMRVGVHTEVLLSFCWTAAGVLSDVWCAH